MLDFSFEKIWFLDAFGHILCYSPYRRSFLRGVLQGFQVSGCLASPYPFPEGCQPHWYDIFGRVIKGLDFAVVEQGPNLVSLFDKKKKLYLSADPSRNVLTYMPQAHAWESFCLLPIDPFMGLQFLYNSTMLQIYDEAGNSAEKIIFARDNEKKEFTFLLNRKRINILTNIENIGRIGRLQVGEEIDVVFERYFKDRKYKFNVKRVNKYFF